MDFFLFVSHSTFPTYTISSTFSRLDIHLVRCSGHSTEAAAVLAIQRDVYTRVGGKKQQRKAKKRRAAKSQQSSTQKRPNRGGSSSSSSSAECRENKAQKRRKGREECRWHSTFNESSKFFAISCFLFLFPPCLRRHRLSAQSQDLRWGLMGRSR